jgi:hypothetical protein
MTITAQAGLQLLDAATALRTHGLQLLTNVEIGNATPAPHVGWDGLIAANCARQ